VASEPEGELHVVGCESLGLLLHIRQESLEEALAGALMGLIQEEVVRAGVDVWDQSKQQNSEGFSIQRAHLSNLEVGLDCHLNWLLLQEQADFKVLAAFKERDYTH
jgi:hypothetical protein